MLQFGTLPEATPVVWAPFVPLQFGAAQTQPILMVPAGTEVPTTNTDSGPLTKTQKRRKRRQAQASHQETRIVEMPTIPISNTFSPLRHVKKNAFRAHLRQAGEEPGPEVTQAPEAPSKPNNKPQWAQQVKRVYTAVQKRER